MTRAELRYIVARHEKWLRHPDSGERADLSRADLRGADLRGADLRGADLSRADLRGADLSWADLRGADLSWADLHRANLHRADLHRADLRRADLSRANLSRANLRRANLSRANLDYSVWPLWCGSLHVKADDNLVIQMLYHTLDLAQNSDLSDELRAALDTDALIEQANRFHRVDECGQLNRWEREEGAENGLHSGRT